MTGSGTVGDPYIISDVDDLQAMEDDLDAHYELANNIDASATSSWNSGLGFDPIGTSVTTYYTYILPTDDLRIEGDYVYTYPDDGVYWDKIDDAVGSPDEDATYNRQNIGNASWFVYEASSPTVYVDHDASDISVRLYIRSKRSGTNRHYGVLRVNSVDYATGDYILPNTSYATKYWTINTNPATEVVWTVGDINAGIKGFGWHTHYGNGWIRTTQVYIRVSYTLDRKFTGTFDGKGYTISDLYINRPTEDEVGLFGYTDGATIEDVTLSSPDITGDDFVGGFIGTADDTTITDVPLTNISITGDDNVGGVIGYLVITTATLSNLTVSSGVVLGGDLCTGGIVGLIGSGGICTPIFDSCSCGASVTGGTGALSGVGGFTGEDMSDGTTYTNCYATGNVSAAGNSYYIGGFMGYTREANTTFTSCYASGDVSGYRAVGGFVGESDIDTSDSETNYSKCYATGDVTGDRYVGGFGGELEGTCTNCYARGATTGTGTTYVGGFAGWSDVLVNCYSTGVVTGSGSYVGGFIGRNYVSATNCFWDTQTSGQASSDGGTGKTTQLMKSLGTFHNASWDIVQSTTDRNDGYPFLSWEIDESDSIWKIYGGVGGEDGYYSLDFPDLMDDHGRRPKSARVRAIRTDTHQVIEEERTDQNGTCTFDELPVGQDIVFHAIWGGVTSAEKEEWFFLRVNEIEDGGTGAGSAATARDNLGVNAAAILWELVLGD